MFGEAPDGLDNALVTRHAWSRLVVMMNGYREAANMLVERATEHRSDGDSLLYPIIFCYRHSLELELKYVLVTYGRHAGEGPDWQNHDLDRLWPSVRRVIEYFDPDPDPSETAALSAVEECIAEFAKIDAGSFTFRYPVNRNGQPIEVSFDRLNLAQLRDTMEGIHNFFMGLDGYLDDCVSNAPYEYEGP